MKDLLELIMAPVGLSTETFWDPMMTIGFIISFSIQGILIIDCIYPCQPQGVRSIDTSSYIT